MTDKSEIVNKFNAYFTNIGSNLAKNIKYKGINYCIMARGFESSRIIKLQKKALRIITLSNYMSHTEPPYKKLTLLKVDDILHMVINTDTTGKDIFCKLENRLI